MQGFASPRLMTWPTKNGASGVINLSTFAVNGSSTSASEPGNLLLRQKGQDRLRLRPAREMPVRPRATSRAAEGSGIGVQVAYVERAKEVKSFEDPVLPDNMESLPDSELTAIRTRTTEEATNA
jgi:hypothetical protein